MKKIGKLNFKKMATNALIVAGTGAGVQILKEAVLPENPETMDYILIGAGLVLPEVIKSPEVETAAGAMLAIGAYRMADRLELASKIGVNDTTAVAPPAAQGFRDVNQVGRSWNPANAGSKSERKVERPANVQVS